MARLTAFFCLTPAAAIYQGAIKILQEGAPMDLHVVANGEKGAVFTTNDRSVTLKWGGELRGFVAEKKTDEMTPSMYHNFTLLDKEISYDVDLSQVGCSCNAALFFVTAPGYYANGTVAKGDSPNPYYCDAFDIGGVSCWEHDTIEGNMYTVATTPHTCEGPPGQYISGCDKAGCGINAWDMDPEGFCPDEKCTIDSRFPYRIHQRYEANGAGKLIRIANRMRQNGNVFNWDSCTDPEYLEKMTAAFTTGMAMVFQLWGSTWENMKWLDEMTGCKGDCNVAATEVTFSNIDIRTLGGPHKSEAVVVV